MKCTSIFGHKWTRWFRFLGVVKEKEGYFQRSIGMRRRCIRCYYEEQVWLNSAIIINNGDNK